MAPTAARCPLALLLSLLCLVSPATAADETREHVDRIEKHAKDPFEQRQRETAIRALGRLGGKKAAQVLAPLMTDPFVHIRDHALSAWIKMMSGDRAGESQTWISTKAIKARDREVRIAAWTALGITGGAELGETFRLGAKSEKDGAVLAALAEAALRLREGTTIEGAFSERLDHKDGRAVFALARAAAKFEGQACLKPLRAALKHRKPMARAGAVLALQELDALTGSDLQRILGDKAVEPRIALADSLWRRTTAAPWPGHGEVILWALLTDEDWRVRAAAVQGALRIWHPLIVEMLIRRLEQETGRVQEDVQRALETFTGRTVAMDPDLWKAWWGANGETFQPDEQPRLNDAQRIPFRDASDRPGEQGGTAAFFDLPLYSKRIVFVFDLSGSFRNAAYDGEGAPTKLELLQEEFAKTLKALGADTMFDLMVYRYPSDYPPKPKMTRAFGKLQAADSRSIKKAQAWLAKQPAKGWGAFVEPLEAIMEEDVDTAVLLSDGRPSRGRFDRDWRILQELPRPNRFRYLAVNTVLIGEKGADRKFMEGLASITGGRFRATTRGK